ncbi:hypothetical protein SAMN05444339_101146 [Loktanella atrilutea]|uniref:Uncharacterized protein n=1 Tax=Loktanella atrilutea TaxID=366533 RepID=A0A1M4SUL3_LOKAT|nr:hypothetical protein [Loktanella atrilutea]SHE35896.1 hypothetical protein SAMN05444339_101146 [Loktanella atrilutea]
MDGNPHVTSERPTKGMLLAARMASLNRYPATTEAKALIDDVLNDILEFESAGKLRSRARKAKDLEAFRAGLGALVADLLVHSLNVEAGGYCYRGFGPMSFEGSYATTELLTQYRDRLVALGLVEYVPGYQTSANGYDRSAKVSRFRATPDLLAKAADQLELTVDNLKLHFVIDRSLGFPITLKRTAVEEGKAKRMPFDKTDPIVRGLARDMTRINDYLQQHSFNLGLDPLYRRGFHGGDRPGFQWNLGGRMFDYAEVGLTNMKREVRPGITIDGEKTCEVDIKACMLTIIYGVTGTPFDLKVDLYAVDGVARPLVKKLVNMAIGKGGAPTQWPSTFKAELVEQGEQPIPKGLKAKDAWTKVLIAHPIMGRLNEHGLGWPELQYIESEVLMATLLELMDDHDVCALPIHDGVIVAVSHADVVERVFSGNFERLVGVRPNISVKGKL